MKVKITVEMEASKRKKLIAVAHQHDIKVSPLMRQFAAKFIRDPKKCLDLIKE